MTALCYFNALPQIGGRARIVETRCEIAPRVRSAAAAVDPRIVRCRSHHQGAMEITSRVSTDMWHGEQPRFVFAAFGPVDVALAKQSQRLSGLDDAARRMVSGRYGGRTAYSAAILVGLVSSTSTCAAQATSMLVRERPSRAPIAAEDEIEACFARAQSSVETREVIPSVLDGAIGKRTIFGSTRRLCAP